MKRFHVHLRVYDIEPNVRFYTALFGVEPAAREEDCAQWIVDDPPLALTVSARGDAPGVELLGFHADSCEELEDLRYRFAQADGCDIEQPEAAEGPTGNAHWLIDPQGILWEAKTHAAGRPGSKSCHEATRRYANSPSAECDTRSR